MIGTDTILDIHTAHACELLELIDHTRWRAVNLYKRESLHCTEQLMRWLLAHPLGTTTIQLLRLDTTVINLRDDQTGVKTFAL